MAGASFSICSIIILIIFAFNFFSKEYIKTTETYIYRNLLILTLVGTILDVFSFAIYKTGVDTSSILYVLTAKVVFIYFVGWILLFLQYVYSISEKYFIKINGTKLNIVFIIIALLILLSPLHYQFTANSLYPYGTSVTLTYGTVAISLLFICILIIENLKKIRHKKYIPVFLIVLMVITATVLQKLIPDLFLINFSLTIVVVTMYFTIENPDVRTIETLLRNKELVEQTVNDKSNFLFKVSQEMKKPVKDILDSIKEYDNAKNAAEKEEIIKQIEQDANNAYFIINDITDVSSMDFKKIKMQENTYITKKLFVDTEAYAKNSLSVAKKDKDIKFNIKIHNSYPDKLCGDYIKLKQILLSIISNSIKNTTEGFIDFEVDAVTRYDICRLIFTIRDSGKGMSITEINKLLSSNEEVKAEEFDKIDSLDLNMPVVIKIIKMLGGSISIRSEGDKGLIVVVVIDQKIGKSNSDIRIEGAKKYSSNIKTKRRVLIADDSNEELEKLGRLFSKYELDTVQTLVGHDVIDKINSGDEYDLIVLKDEMKPDTAFAILKKLKEMKQFSIPVVIMITKDKEFIKDHFMEDGFADCMIEERIEDEVKRICEKYI